MYFFLFFLFFFFFFFSFNWFYNFIKKFFSFFKFCLQVLLCRKFQITILRVLIDRNLNKLREVLDGLCLEDNLEIDYLLLPGLGEHHRPSIIDWDSVVSVIFSCENHVVECSKGYAHSVQTKDGPVCTCMLRNSLVYTPHNGNVYCITGILGLNGNALLTLRDGRTITYKQYYEERYAIAFSILFCLSSIPCFGFQCASIYSLPCQWYVILV